MNTNHADYWKWVVLKSLRDGSFTAGAVSVQYDSASALSYLIKHQYVDLYGASFQEARLTLTQRGLDYLNELDAIK